MILVESAALLNATIQAWAHDPRVVSTYTYVLQVSPVWLLLVAALGAVLLARTLRAPAD